MTDTPGTGLRALLLLAALGITTVLITNNTLWRIDLWLYDQSLTARTWFPSSDARVLIVAIDEQSLARIGQWPWSRSTHATLVQRLHSAGARGIAFDLMFAEAHALDPDGDAQLAAAMRAAGNVVLPVSVTRQRQHGRMIEIQPMPMLVEAAQALGHSDVAEDRDGLARGVFLRAGLGAARWSALGLALLEGDHRTADDELAGLRRPATGRTGAANWVRDHYALMPFSGPAGTLTQISYIDVLEQRIPAELIQDRWIVVAMNAAGHAGSVNTPLHSGQHLLSGGEYHAQVIKMLLDDRAITPMQTSWRIVLSALFVLLPFALWGKVSFQLATALFVSQAVVLLLASAGLLFVTDRWLPPAAPLIVLLGAIPLLLTLHLRLFHHQAGHDVMTGLANRRGLREAFRREWPSARRSKKPISLLLIDVDHFKAFNDRYGHRKGDEALRSIATAIGDAARRSRDLAVRVGGEEFALLLPETDSTAAAVLADKLRMDVMGLCIPHHDSQHGQIATVSIGIGSCVPNTRNGVDALYDCADQALYHAKMNGRNRVSRYDHLQPENAQ